MVRDIGKTARSTNSNGYGAVELIFGQAGAKRFPSPLPWGSHVEDGRASRHEPHR